MMFTITPISGTFDKTHRLIIKVSAEKIIDIVYPLSNSKSKY